MEQGNSPPRQDDTTSNIKEVLDQLRVHYKNKDTASLSGLLRGLKASCLDSKPNIRRFSEAQGWKLVCAILGQYASEYVTRPSTSSVAQLLSLVVGIMGNCCNQSNSARLEVLSNSTLSSLLRILSVRDFDNTGKLWSDTVKLLLVLRLQRPEHVSLLCEFGVVESLLPAFGKNDSKLVGIVLKLLKGLTHSQLFCLRLSNSNGISVLMEYLDSSRDDSTTAEVLKILTNILNQKHDSIASRFNEHSGVYKTIELYQSKNSDVRRAAWDCFLACNHSSETRASIGNAGGIQLIINKLSLCKPTDIPYHLPEILSTCSKDPSNRQHIKSAKGLQLIINLLKQVQSAKTQVQLLQTLTGYYFDENTFTDMVKHLNLVDSLTHILEHIVDEFKVGELTERAESETSLPDLHTPTSGWQMNELSFLAVDPLLHSATSSGSEQQDSKSMLHIVEHQVFTLLSRISHIKCCILHLASSETFRATINYSLASSKPHPKSVKILQRISQDNACFEKLLRDGNVPLFYELCIHAENLPTGFVGMSKLNIPDCPFYVPTQEYNFLDNLARAAETPFGIGVISSMLRGSASERRTCVLSLPYLCRTQKKRFFHDFSGTVRSLIDILSNPFDEEQFQQSIKVFSYFCESLHRPTPPDIPHRLCQSPTSPLSRSPSSPSSCSPPHEYNPYFMYLFPGQSVPLKNFEDSGSDVSSGCVSDDDFLFEPSNRRQSRLDRAIRPEIGSIEYCPPVKRPRIEPDSSILCVEESLVLSTEQTNNCLYKQATEFDFEFCVEESRFPVHTSRISASSDVLSAMIRWAHTNPGASHVNLTLVPAFIFELLLHQIYNCDLSCPVISSILFPDDTDATPEGQKYNEIQQKHIDFLSAHGSKLSSSLPPLLNEVFQATLDHPVLSPGYQDLSYQLCCLFNKKGTVLRGENLFTYFLHLLALFFTTDLLLMDHKARVTAQLEKHINPNNAVQLLVLSIEFRWSLLANKICHYIFKDFRTSTRRGCLQQIMKYPQSVTDEILDIFSNFIMEKVSK